VKYLLVRLLSELRELRFWFLILGVGIGLGAGLLTAVGVRLTSDEKFCTLCHTMEPMAKSYRKSLHGGNNTSGWKAKCTDCHLPHTNEIYDLMIKTKFGLHDTWAQLTYDLDKIDWHVKRAHRADFVFDSGCLKCHQNLEKVNGSNKKAFMAHRDYFRGLTGNKCVDCHEHVGHHALGLYLPKVKKTEAKEK
jgi:cytochrome c-type protein NapC